MSCQGTSEALGISRSSCDEQDQPCSCCHLSPIWCNIPTAIQMVLEKLTPGMPASPDEGSLCSPHGRRVPVAGGREVMEMLHTPTCCGLLSSCVWQALSSLRHLSVPPGSLHERFPSVWTAQFGHAPSPLYNGI